MRRASYRDAVAWLVTNDDCEWLKPEEHVNGEPLYSVTAMLVADLFGVEPEKVATDMRRELAKWSMEATR